MDELDVARNGNQIVGKKKWKNRKNGEMRFDLVLVFSFLTEFRGRKVSLDLVPMCPRFFFLGKVGNIEKLDFF